MSLSKTQFKGDFHHISEVIDQGMPVVMFDRVSNEILCDKVIIDDWQLTKQSKPYRQRQKKNSLVTTVDYVM
jgi:LacI family transcriptional regulator